MLVTLGLTAGACTTHPPGKGHGEPPVLGQRSGTPAVVGQPAPAGTGQLDAVSCAGVDRCWAVGSPGPAPTTVIDATFDGGRTWIAQPLDLASAPDLTGISCPGARLCMAVGLSGSGSAGIVLTTRDAGSSWRAVAIPAEAAVITGVECSGAADCTVIATDGTTFWSAHSNDFGHTWQRGGNLPAGLQDAGSLTCITGGSCLVTGITPATAGHAQGAIVISSDSGATWTASNVPAQTGLLQTAVCVTATSCVAAGTTSTTVSAVVPAQGELLMSQDGGQTWTRSPAPPSIGDVYGIVCPSARICAMVGTKWIGHPAIGSGGVAQSRDGGRSFTAATTEYTPLPLTALACPGVRACVGVGGDTLARITLVRARRGAAATSTTPTTQTGGVHRPALNGRD